MPVDNWRGYGSFADDAAPAENGRFVIRIKGGVFVGR